MSSSGFGVLDGLQAGVWAYRFVTLTSGSVTAVGRDLSIRLVAVGADASVNINGGDTIIVRNGMGLDLNPGGNLFQPVVNWVSGTMDVFVEELT